MYLCTKCDQSTVATGVCAVCSPPLFDSEAFGKSLTTALTERGLSFRKAATETGVSHYTLHRVARGKFRPDVEVYLRLNRWMERAEA